MLTVYAAASEKHNPEYETHRGRRVRCFENPRRAAVILEHLRAAGLAEIIEPDKSDLPAGIHKADYLEFLRTAHDEWAAEGGEGDLVPYVWPQRNSRWTPGRTAHARLGHYASDAGTPIVAGTWDAVTASAAGAVTAARRIQAGTPAAFALTRPPGHHASADVYGGYSFVNHAAVAAQTLRDGGAARIAILDIDYHHGNGTQAIFWDRPDVLFASIHADPDFAYPYFSGRADERGEGDGLGTTLNLPLPAGTALKDYMPALEKALEAVREFQADYVVVSAGLDTHKDDPICSFNLESADFVTVGRSIAGFNRPTVFVLEGGYAIDVLGVNVVNLLTGFHG